MGGGEGGGGILFSSISCYFLGYARAPPPPQTHTPTQKHKLNKKTAAKMLVKKAVLLWTVSIG